LGEKIAQSGTDVLIFEIFSPKKLAKFVIITLVFEKNANFFAENCQKSQKIVIITSTPGHPDANARGQLPIYAI
jgi:hypothetical protein